MATPHEGEVYADGYIKVPAGRWFHLMDALSRKGDLEEAILRVLGKINEKLAAPRPAPPAVPPIVPPAPIAWTPLTDRLDVITRDFREYLGYIKSLPIARVARYTGAAVTWQTLVSWNVGRIWAKRFGMLREISMISNNLPNTRFRLRIELGSPLNTKVTIFDEVTIQAALTLPFPENLLPYDTWVYLDVRSLGPAIVADGAVAGSEWS